MENVSMAESKIPSNEPPKINQNQVINNNSTIAAPLLTGNMPPPPILNLGINATTTSSAPSNPPVLNLNPINLAQPPQMNNNSGVPAPPNLMNLLANNCVKRKF
jgi:hypothetical protein